ncbi:uncharacterized protein [Dysidea avara]|uniref:uncharacterized protein isoform X2 n=1 Tax=Dysidea avara TaxID=196820 RepID=UPI0033166BA2
MSDLEQTLKQVTLAAVDSDGRELGRGAYAKVFTVKYREIVYAAKEIHSILVEGVGEEQKQAIKKTFLRECYQCSTLHHENIVQFIGICYLRRDSYLPVMIMELMDRSLTSFVSDKRSDQPKVHIKVKLSILLDVSRGLTYLHSRDPPIMHRDLSPNNVMLTDKLVAKIGDLGVAKVIQADSKQTKSKLTTAPGTADFMPLESLTDNPEYDTSLDIFSFGGVMLFLINEEWPTPTAAVKYDPKTRRLKAFTEVERRRKYLDKMVGKQTDELKLLVSCCLDDDPKMRPNTTNLSDSLKVIADGSTKLLHTKFSDIKLKPSSSMPDLSSIQSPPLPPRPGYENIYRSPQMSRRGPLLRFDDDDDDDPPPIPPYSLRCVKPPLSLHLLKSSPAISIKRPKSQLAVHSSLRDNLSETSTSDDPPPIPPHLPTHRRRSPIPCHVDSLPINHESCEAVQHVKHSESLPSTSTVRPEKLAVHSSLRDNLSETSTSDDPPPIPRHSPTHTRRPPIPCRVDSLPINHVSCETIQHLKRSESLPSTSTVEPEKPVKALPLVSALESGQCHIKWTRCADLPHKMYGASVAGDNENVYVTDTNSPCHIPRNIVYCYDISMHQWKELPEPEQYYFVLLMVNGQLTAIGGLDFITLNQTSKVSTFSKLNNSWISLYPNLLIPRSKPGAVVHCDHVIVAGGQTSDGIADDIEILNWKQLPLMWKRASVYLPCPMFAMHLTICEEDLYIVGYDDDKTTYQNVHFINITTVVSLDNSALNSHVDSLWSKLPSIPLTRAGVASTCPILIAGGSFKGVITSNIFIYDSHDQIWTKVASLTSPRSNVAIATINNTTIMVIGGYSKGGSAEAAAESSLTTVELGEAESIH